MPIFTRTQTGPVFQRDEAGAVDHSNVEAAVLGIATVGAADCETAARCSEASPIARARCARGIAPRLVGAAGEGDNITRVGDAALLPALHARKLGGRRWLRAAQNVDGAKKLRDLEFQRGDLSQLRVALGELLGELLPQLLPRDGNYRTQDANKLLVAMVSKQLQGVRLSRRAAACRPSPC